MQLFILLIILTLSPAKISVIRGPHLDQLQKLPYKKLDESFNYDFVLVHTSNIVGEIGPINRYNGKCSKHLSLSDMCYGGLDRLMTA